MHAEPLITIIVPVYNVEGYLKKCIESILAQTYKNLQIILVDDGSTDNSGYICEDYAQKDKRISVIHKINGGLSSARNAGIDKAEGEFISCIDSDDYVVADFILTLYQHAMNNDADMVVGNFFYYYENEFKKSHGNGEILKICNTKEAIELIGTGKNFTGSAWGKLYKKELLANIRYPEGKLCEDQFVIYKLILLCQTVVFDSAALYGYTIRPGSIMSSSITERMLDVIDAAKQNSSIILEKFPQLEYICVLRQVDAYFEILNRLTLRSLQNATFLNVVVEAREYICHNLKEIVKDTFNIYSKKQKGYCIVFVINPKAFIWIHSTLLSIKEKRYKKWQQ